MQAPQAPACMGLSTPRACSNTCFAHSPAGALLAAINLWAESTAAPPSQVFARLAIERPANLGNGAGWTANGPVQFAGYRYDSYSRAEAQIAVVLQGPGGEARCRS